MKKTILAVAAVAVVLLALVVPAGADTVSSWFIAGPDQWTPAIETWTSTSGGTGDGLRTIINVDDNSYLCIGRDRPGILNQTGGTITNNSRWGTNIGRFTWGTYNMSGTAVFNTLGSPIPEVDLGTCEWGDLGTWTLTDQASATVGNVGLGVWGNKGTGLVLLSGNASLNATGLTFATTPSYLSFASGSTATLTVANKVLSDYQALVAAGDIRVDGATQSDFSKFKVAGNTLSLAPPVGTLVIEKYWDKLADGSIAGDPKLGDWWYMVDGGVGMVNDADLDGIITIEDLAAGPYTVTELPAGWTCTYDTDGVIGGLGTVLATVMDGQITTVRFGNAIPEPAGLGLMGLLLLAARKRRS